MKGRSKPSWPTEMRRARESTRAVACNVPGDFNRGSFRTCKARQIPKKVRTRMETLVMLAVSLYLWCSPARCNGELASGSVGGPLIQAACAVQLILHVTAEPRLTSRERLKDCATLVSFHRLNPLCSSTTGKCRRTKTTTRRMVARATMSKLCRRERSPAGAVRGPPSWRRHRPTLPLPCPSLGATTTRKQPSREQW